MTRSRWGWCWHKWTRWHQFVYVSEEEHGSGRRRMMRTAMQERTCKKCGKRQEEKV